MKKVKIYIHKTNKDAIMPKIEYNGTSGGFDVCSIEKVVIKPKECARINTGIRIMIDEKDSYFMLIQLRSSIAFNKKGFLFMGVIDAGYTGEISYLLYNFGDEDLIINKNEKFAQILVIEKPKTEIIELNDAEFKEFELKQQRGSKGFGSSGK